LVPGRLVRRYQRFLAEVELSHGGVVTAHCPNSGSMLGCLKPGAAVRLSHQPHPKRRTAYTWEMIRIGHSWVGINTLVPNRLVEMAARAQALPLFAGAREVRREVRVSPRSRVDLWVRQRDKELFVEVKNVTLVRDGLACFPDAPTTRGRRHLQELIRLATRPHTTAAMIYLVQRSDARAFAPAADIDPAYAQAFQQARRAGVKVVVLQATVSPRAIALHRTLPLAAVAKKIP
jgi:sugar fermentation stimulation protein A